jgi:retron-type reverse transcriptase
MIFNEEHKSQLITKLQVNNAFKKIKANKGSPVVDGIIIETVSNKIRNYLNPLWNRISSGSCSPKPVRQVLIPMGKGKMRPFDIPTILDRLAKQVIAAELSNDVDKYFSLTVLVTDLISRHTKP